jgi:hypothetical protein
MARQGRAEEGMARVRKGVTNRASNYYYHDYYS